MGCAAVSGFRLIPGINAGAIHSKPRWGYRFETRGVLKIDYCFLSVDYFASLNSQPVTPFPVIPTTSGRRNLPD
jgi:hypothetical protein